MKLYALASRSLNEIEHWHATREEAEVTLAQALADEPEWEDDLYVAEVEVDSGDN